MPRPLIRCNFFDDDGKVIDETKPCRMGSENCSFVHPDRKADWERALQPRFKRGTGKRAYSPRPPYRRPVRDRDSSPQSSGPRGSSPPRGPRNYRDRHEREPQDADRNIRAYERSERVREQKERERERERERDRERDRDNRQRDRDLERAGPSYKSDASKGKERERDSSPPSTLDLMYASSKASKIAGAPPVSASPVNKHAPPPPPSGPAPDRPFPPNVFKPIGSRHADSPVPPSHVLPSPISALQQTLPAAALEIPPKPTKRAPKRLTEEERAELSQRWSTHISHLADLTQALGTAARIRKEIEDLTALQSAPYFANAAAAEKRHVETTISQHRVRLLDLKGKCEMLSTKADANMWPERPTDVQKFVDALAEQATKVVDGLSDLKLSIEAKTKTEEPKAEEGGISINAYASGSGEAMDVDDDDVTTKKGDRDLDIEELCLQLQNVENGIFQTQQDIEAFREDVLEQVRDHIASHVNTGVSEESLVDVRKEIEDIEKDANGFADEIMNLWTKNGEHTTELVSLNAREASLRSNITNIHGQLQETRRERQQLSSQLSALSAGLAAHTEANPPAPAPRLDLAPRALSAALERPVTDQVRAAVQPIVNGFRNDIQTMLDEQSREVKETLSPKLTLVLKMVSTISKKVKEHEEKGKQTQSGGQAAAGN